MKNALSLLMGLVFSFGSIAHAKTDCQTLEGRSHASVGMMVSDDQKVYWVDIVALSRLAYSATYVANKAPRSAAGQLVLTKVSDESTWQDMPETLTLRYNASIQSGYYYQLQGLDIGTINFTPEDCSPSQGGL